MGRPALHYTLHVSLPDDTDRITITSPEVPGLLIWAPPQEAFADVHESVKKLRLLNARAEKETGALCPHGNPVDDTEHQCRKCGPVESG